MAARRAMRNTRAIYDRRRSSRANSSSAEMVSPRSASPMASSRSASSSGDKSAAMSASLVNTIMVSPSGRSSPSTTSFPATTVPVATCMIWYSINMAALNIRPHWRSATRGPILASRFCIQVSFSKYPEQQNLLHKSGAASLVSWPTNPPESGLPPHMRRAHSVLNASRYSGRPDAILLGLPRRT